MPGIPHEFALGGNDGFATGGFAVSTAGKVQSPSENRR